MDISQDQNALALYCSTLSPLSGSQHVPNGTCYGLCSDAGLAGPGTRIAFYGQVALTAYSIVWLKNPSDQRRAYFIQYMSSLALFIVVNVFVNVVSLYHAIIVDYLSFGLVACSVVAFNMRTFAPPEREDDSLSNSISPVFIAFLLAALAFPIAEFYVIMAAVNDANYGFQPECNPNIVTSPFLLHGGHTFIAFACISIGIGLLVGACSNGRHRIFNTVLTICFLVAWIILTERLLTNQGLSQLTADDHSFGRSQISSIVTFGISALYPAGALYRRITGSITGREDSLPFAPQYK